MTRTQILTVLGLVASSACGAPERTMAKDPDAGTTHDGDVGDQVSHGDAGNGDVAVDAACEPEPSDECRTFPLCGCPPDQNCFILNSTQNLGCGFSGSKGTHQVCGSANQCLVGYGCLNGLCVPYCGGDADCQSPMPGGVCRNVLPGLDVCMSQCDVLDPAPGCGAGLGCGFHVDAVTTSCRRAGAGKGLGACATDSLGCAPGHVCLFGDCRSWCRVTVPTDCLGGKVCESFTDHPTAGGVEYGSCAL